MSVKSLVWAWNLKIKIASHKLVLLTLADNSNDQGECFPRLETIARRCGLKIRPLQKVINKLKAAGYLDTEPRHRKDGRQTSNLFYLNMMGKFSTIDEEELPVHKGDTMSHRTSPPCPTGHPHPVPQDVPPLAQNVILLNKTNDLQSVQNQQLKGLTKKINYNKRYSASDDARKINDTSFDQFWNLYPIKKNKIRTKKIWDQRNYGKIADIICLDVERRKLEEAQWKDPQFIPHPDTYLRNERWTDDITKSVPKKTGGNSALSEYLSGATQSGTTYDEHGDSINPFN